jgi:hypothetical protein
MESVKVICREYFPAFSEAVGLITNDNVSVSSFIKEGRFYFDCSTHNIEMA